MLFRGLVTAAKARESAGATWARSRLVFHVVSCEGDPVVAVFITAAQGVRGNGPWAMRGWSNAQARLLLRVVRGEAVSHRPAAWRGSEHRNPVWSAGEDEAGRLRSQTSTGRLLTISTCTVRVICLAPACGMTCARRSATRWPNMGADVQNTIP